MIAIRIKDGTMMRDYVLSVQKMYQDTAQSVG